MAVTSLAGYLITVKVGTADHSAQIESGSMARDVNVVTTMTLAGTGATLPNQVDTATAVTDTVDLQSLYDGDQTAGLFKALWDASDAGAGVTVELTDRVNKYSGTMLVAAIGVDFGAEDSTKSPYSLTGRLTRAAVAP
jgi:hypothetical protein